jgi:hypothetical protein
MPPRAKEYIGDGVYASIENDMIRIETQREDGQTHYIYLEPEVWRDLTRFVEKHGAENENVEISDRNPH